MGAAMIVSVKRVLLRGVFDRLCRGCAPLWRTFNPASHRQPTVDARRQRGGPRDATTVRFDSRNPRSRGIPMTSNGPTTASCKIWNCDGRVVPRVEDRHRYHVWVRQIGLCLSLVCGLGANLGVRAERLHRTGLHARALAMPMPKTGYSMAASLSVRRLCTGMSDRKRAAFPSSSGLESGPKWKTR